MGQGRFAEDWDGTWQAANEIMPTEGGPNYVVPCAGHFQAFKTVDPRVLWVQEIASVTKSVQLMLGEP